MKPSDLARVVIDTTVQPKAVMFPTYAKLLNRARERLVRLTKKLGVSLRQSYARVGKLALIKHQRYAPMPISSSAPTAAYASSRPISAVSSAARSIPCTRQRSSASARAKRTGLEFGVKVSVVTG
jgi:IS5 family transposase